MFGNFIKSLLLDHRIENGEGKTKLFFLFNILHVATFDTRGNKGMKFQKNIFYKSVKSGDSLKWSRAFPSKSI